MVAVAVVGQLVGQHMGADLLILRGLGGQVDRGPEQAEDTGSGHRLRHVDAQQTVGCGIFVPSALQLQAQMEVADTDDRSHHRHPREPDLIQQRLQIQLQIRPDHVLGGFFDDDGVVALVELLLHGLVIGHHLPVGFVVFLLIPLLVGGSIDLPDGLRDIHLFCDGTGAEGAGEQLHRQQQPHQHHCPQSVLQSQADLPPEQEPDRQHRGDQKGRGKDPLIHHGAAPPRLAG